MNPDGTVLASIPAKCVPDDMNETCDIVLWDAVEGKRLLELHGHPCTVMHLKWSKDGRTLLSVDWEGGTRLWKLEKLSRPSAAWRFPARSTKWFWDPGKREVACVAGDGEARLYDAQSGRLKQSLQVQRLDPEYESECACPLAFDVQELAGSAFAIENPEAKKEAQVAIHVLDLKQPKRVSLKGHIGRVSVLAFHPSRPVLASGAADGSVRLWDIERPTIVHTLTGHSGTVEELAFSKDGSCLFTNQRVLTAPRTILWDVRRGRRLDEWDGCLGDVPARGSLE